MPPYQQPEDQAREQIDTMLEAAGWTIQSKAQLNLSAAGRVVVSKHWPTITLE